MTKPLLPVLLAGLLAGAAAHCQAASDTTAYAAMRIMGKALGDETITRVVEVTGRGGAPQPQTWRIVILDGARSTKEIMVAGGRITSQKNAGQSALKPIHLNDLNLDSSGAFETADKEARKARVPFTAVDYSLRVSATTGKPVWELELFNAERAHVGGIRFAAHDGNILSTNGLTSGQSTTTRSLVSTHDADHDTVRPTRVSPSGRNTTTTTTTTTYNNVRPTPPPPEDDDTRRNSSSNDGGFFSRAGRTLDHTSESVGDTLSRTGHTVNRTVRRTGAKIQRFFTGDSNGGDND